MAVKEKNCKWTFAVQADNSQEIGPNNAMAQNFRKSPYPSLIRESIQNSLDAILDDSKPVVVKYSFITMDGNEYPNLFELKEHIQGCKEYYSDNVNAEEVYGPMLKRFDDQRFQNQLCCVRVSDYNTKGMNYIPNNTKSPFYAFVRSAGVSAKENLTAGGSFGFGKAAYFLISPISTVLVSTCTSDNQKCFEGVASLCTHTHGGSKYSNVGFYDCNGGLPTCQENQIPEGFVRNEPGTDINILGFDISEKDEAIKEMVEAVLWNFWFAVKSGKLEVEIEDVKITADCLSELMDAYFGGDDVPKKNPKPFFDVMNNVADGSKYFEFEEDLLNLGHVTLRLKREKHAPDKIVYMRLPKMLVECKGHRSHYGYYAVFYCDDPNGNDYLRKMENPAHDEWKAANWKENRRTSPKGREIAKELSDFVDRCMQQLFSGNGQKVASIKGLDSFLYIPTSYEEDDDLESESLIGDPTGDVKDEGGSPTASIKSGSDNPTITEPDDSAPKGTALVVTPPQSAGGDNGKLHTGNGKNKPKTKGAPPNPGDGGNGVSPTDDGKKGTYAEQIDVGYRTFCQVENGVVYHYVCLHSDEAYSNARLSFKSVGEDSNDKLSVIDSDCGTANGQFVEKLSIPEGKMRIKVRFGDDMKHAVVLSAEVVHE